MLAGAYRYTKPAKPTFSQDSGEAGTNRDGNAVRANDSTDLVTLADELARIADELHVLNRNLSVTRHDGEETVGFARIFIENGNSRACW